MSFLYDHLPKIAIGILVIIVGFSFIWKGWQGCVMGRFSYWAGFLPFTLVSPWLVHLPQGKRSLVKTKEGMLAHILIGPSFFLCAVLCICAGTDLVGLPGTKTLNHIINGGDEGKPTSISFNENTGRYDFPLAKRASEKFYKQVFEHRISDDKDFFGRKIDKMLPDERTNLDGQRVSKNKYDR
jgi:hypothetical protein